jgi:hypothetical protein
LQAHRCGKVPRFLANALFGCRIQSSFAGAYLGDERRRFHDLRFLYGSRLDGFVVLGAATPEQAGHIVKDHVPGGQQHKRYNG